MADLKFGTGGERRSMVLPVVLALLVLLVAAAWFTRVYVHPAVTGSVTSAAMYPVHVEYKRPSSHGNGVMTLGSPQTEDAVYVVADVTLRDQSEVPLFLSSFHGSLTLEDGSVMQASTIESGDLPRLFKMFPQLKAIADVTGSKPLQREQTVAKNSTGRGYVVMYYNIPQSVWDKRKGANVSIEFYHQEPMTLPLPK